MPLEPLPEIQILAIIAAVFAIATFAAGQDPRRNGLVLLAACVTGFAAQLLLGPELNRYTPNIRIYFAYVSLAAVLTWGAGLLSIHAAHLLAAKLLNRRPTWWLYCLVGVPILIVIEMTGSNAISMKLYNHRSYTPLMPAVNAMHAPAWLYGYYVVVALVFYSALKPILRASLKPVRLEA